MTELDAGLFYTGLDSLCDEKVLMEVPTGYITDTASFDSFNVVNVILSV